MLKCRKWKRESSLAYTMINSGMKLRFVSYCLHLHPSHEVAIASIKALNTIIQSPNEADHGR